MREPDMIVGGSRGVERSARELLLTAAATIHRRRAQGRYAQLAPVAADQLVHALTGIATGEHRFAEVDLADAVALAHRVVDDDNPELSPLWPHSDVSEALGMGKHPDAATRERTR